MKRMRGRISLRCRAVFDILTAAQPPCLYIAMLLLVITQSCLNAAWATSGAHEAHSHQYSCLATLHAHLTAPAAAVVLCLFHVACHSVA